VSGNYYVVSNHGVGSQYEAQQGKPLVTLYLLDDLAAGIGALGFVAPPGVSPPSVPSGTLRSFPYTQSQLGLNYAITDFGGLNLSQTVGFLVVPAHDPPPDPSGPIAGTAYAMTRSSAQGEVPKLFGFVPNANPSIAPSVISASMPA